MTYLSFVIRFWEYLLSLQSRTLVVSISVVSYTHSVSAVTRTAALGATVPELKEHLNALTESGIKVEGPFDKTLFSMATNDVIFALKNFNARSVVIFGIEVNAPITSYPIYRVLNSSGRATSASSKAPLT